MCWLLKLWFNSGQHNSAHDLLVKVSHTVMPEFSGGRCAIPLVFHISTLSTVRAPELRSPLQLMFFQPPVELNHSSPLFTSGTPMNAPDVSVHILRGLLTLPWKVPICHLPCWKCFLTLTLYYSLISHFRPHLKYCFLREALLDCQKVKSSGHLVA